MTWLGFYTGLQLLEAVGAGPGNERVVVAFRALSILASSRLARSARGVSRLVPILTGLLRLKPKYQNRTRQTRQQEQLEEREEQGERERERGGEVTAWKLNYDDASSFIELWQVLATLTPRSPRPFCLPQLLLLILRNLFKLCFGFWPIVVRLAVVVMKSANKLMMKYSAEFALRSFCFGFLFWVSFGANNLARVELGLRGPPPLPPLLCPTCSASPNSYSLSLSLSLFLSMLPHSCDLWQAEDAKERGE